MYSKLHWTIHFLITLIFGLAALAAHAQASQNSTTAAIHGHVTDPTGALIPGAEVSVTKALGA